MLRISAPKDVPWIVGLIAGTLAWTLTHTVDRLTSAPLISFDLEHPLVTVPGPDGKPILSGSFVVCNLTRETAFKDAHFQIYAGAASNVEGQIEAVRGSFVFPGESFQAQIDPVRAGEFVLRYDVPEMQPHQAWRLRFKGLRVTKPKLFLRMSSPPVLDDHEIPPAPRIGRDISPTPAVSVDQNKGSTTPSESASLKAVQLVEANWQTYLVDHEIGLLAVLACVFIVFLILSVTFLRVSEPTLASTIDNLQGTQGSPRTPAPDIPQIGQDRTL